MTVLFQNASCVVALFGEGLIRSQRHREAETKQRSRCRSLLHQITTKCLFAEKEKNLIFKLLELKFLISFHDNVSGVIER